MPAKLPFNLIQTYLRAKGYFISTSYRESSVCTNSPPWYFETFVWKWNERELART